ncbi:hypothetical protein KJA15_03435 [Patescibacteria group bacterium]|nr:hypothetical protein [Patescibacteria group bacterium]
MAVWTVPELKKTVVFVCESKVGEVESNVFLRSILKRFFNSAGIEPQPRVIYDTVIVRRMAVDTVSSELSGADVVCFERNGKILFVSQGERPELVKAGLKDLVLG